MKKSTQFPGSSHRTRTSDSQGAALTTPGSHGKKGGTAPDPPPRTKSLAATASSSQIEQVISQQVKEAVHSRNTMPGRTQYNPHVTVPWERFSPPRRGQSVAEWYHNLPDPWPVKRPNGNH
ncbi:hypothetical protein PG996_003473 [Apiospora saccharicola]|uniref:Uncharacterized protein n=1 Tax=Apiospora saccharicola TaxID=335842 RepID=A0ABR1W1E0_9PEZI